MIQNGGETLREIDYTSQSEQQKFSLRTLERLDRFRELKTDEPYHWTRIEESFSEEGMLIATKTYEDTIEPQYLFKLKGIAVNSEFLMAKRLGQGEVALFILGQDERTR